MAHAVLSEAETQRPTCIRSCSSQHTCPASKLACRSAGVRPRAAAQAPGLQKAPVRKWTLLRAASFCTSLPQPHATCSASWPITAAMQTQSAIRVARTWAATHHAVQADSWDRLLKAAAWGMHELAPVANKGAISTQQIEGDGGTLAHSSSACSRHHHGARQGVGPIQAGHVLAVGMAQAAQLLCQPPACHSCIRCLEVPAAVHLLCSSALCMPAVPSSFSFVRPATIVVVQRRDVAASLNGSADLLIAPGQAARVLSNGWKAPHTLQLGKAMS